MSLEKITHIEIEVFSKCNRKCNWCPNSTIDRFSHSINMPEKTYLDFLKDIDNKIENKENIKISYSRYNEPLFNIDLLKKRVKQARNIFPTVILEANTNGDYLRKKGSEVLDGLLLDYLNIMDYDCKGIEYGKKLFDQCGIKIIDNSDKHDLKTSKKINQKSISKYNLLGSRKNIKLINYVSDWPKNKLIQNRGGVFYDFDKNTNKEIISNYGNKEKKLIYQPQLISQTNLKGTFPYNTNQDDRRKNPCQYPTIGIYVDYNGSVTPCCNIRSDVDFHKEYILGNINENSIQDIFNNKKSKKFRQLLKSNDWRNYPNPCKYCSKT